MDDSSLGDFFSRAYEELRRLAARVRRNDPSGTLNPTALVNETYLKLLGSHKLAPESLLHFKRIAVRAMRQVLVEAARRRMANKRGAEYAFVTLDEEAIGPVATAETVLSVDGALEELAQLSERQAQLVEYRVFGGLEFEEIARLLDVSKSTVMREWRVAKAWLALQLRRSR